MLRRDILTSELWVCVAEAAATLAQLNCNLQVPALCSCMQVFEHASFC